MLPTIPDDMADETTLRQRLVQVALGRASADRILRTERLLEVHSRHWLADHDVVVSEGRVAWIGPRGEWRGVAGELVALKGSVVPGFGDAHRHIESSMVTPDHEAELVLPRGTTWTCEASHELSNVCGARNLDFWAMPGRAGSPHKIFPLPGSAVPPTAYERTGGHYGHAEQAAHMARAVVPGLDEVMDWPAVTAPDNPSADRLWGTIAATLRARGVVEGHGAGLRDPASISAFAAAGLASDHEGWSGPEVLAKLRAGLFVELRAPTLVEIVAHLLAEGLEDWSQVALVTDDRAAGETLATGAMDANLRVAIRAGLDPERAFQCVSINPARHMRLTPWVGSIAPGRFADLVVMNDVEAVTIREVWANGMRVGEGTRYVGPRARIDWPDWCRNTVRLPRAVTADDFRIAAPREGDVAEAAVLRPFHWADEFDVLPLPVRGGAVQRDPSQAVTKFAVIDRHTGWDGVECGVARMFWRGCGPATPGVAFGGTVAHDSHNIWVVGSCDATMALVANRLAATGGGFVLARDGAVLAEARLEIAGLMTARSGTEQAAEMDALRTAGEAIDWHYEPTYTPRWYPGLPLRLAYATLTCAPWRWVLVAPTPDRVNGFVNITTGESHPIVW